MMLQVIVFIIMCMSSAMIDEMVLSQDSCKSRHGALISGKLLCAEVITEGLAMDV